MSGAEGGNERGGQPRLKRHLSVIAHGADDVELRYGVWNPISHSLTDNSRSGYLHRLISRLDGSSSPAEIAREEGVPREEVEALVDHLQSLDVLESEPASALDHYLDATVPWRAEEDASASRRVVLLGDPGLADPIARSLDGALPNAVLERPGPGDEAFDVLADPDRSWLRDGLELERRAAAFERWSGSLLVHAAEIIDPPALVALNRLCHVTRTPWLHAAVDGPFLLVGPIVIPDRSPCYECLEIRVTMNLRESASYQRYKEALAERAVRAGTLPILPVLREILAAHASLEAVNFLTTGNSFTIGKVLSVYLPTMEFTFNQVLRAPTCPTCAPSPESDDTGLYFDMGAFIDGGHRPAPGG